MGIEVADRRAKPASIDMARKALADSGYSETVIDHYLIPRNFGALTYLNGYGHHKSDCGHSMWMWISVRYGVLREIGFVSDICVGAVAAGSMLTEMAKNRDVHEALGIEEPDVVDGLGGLPQQFAHCAALAVAALRAALKDYLATAKEPLIRKYERSRGR